MAGAIGAPILGRGVSACTTISGCVCYYFACATLVRALVYSNFLREVMLGGWGSEGPKGPTIGQYSECVHHHSVMKWKYVVRFEIRY